MPLIIVESPTKAKTIERFLGKPYVVRSSYGHVRDLPKSKLGVDVENDFAPQYVVSKDKTKQITELKKLAGKADKIILATDEDREGEAIAWHLIAACNLEGKTLERIVFHEITQEAIEEALKNPRTVDMHLVDAQQARRILDRLVGYELSPLLWKKVARGLSAGRVQSVAVRMIVEREREIQAFKAQEYWSIEAEFCASQSAGASAKADDAVIVTAQLASVDGKALDKLAVTNEEQATSLVAKAKAQTYSVASLTRKATKKAPPPPFTTSTLQQAANHRYGFSAKQTMRLAQMLYEGVALGSAGQTGLITYMRTDSMNLAGKFLGEAKSVITDMYGASYAERAPRFYKKKSKNAQEAHEAIRPTSAARAPEDVKAYLEPQLLKLYTLIWQRAIASQMPDAQLETTSIDIPSKDGTLAFRASGSVIKFDGYLKIYPEKVSENLLPELKEKQALDLQDVKPVQHFTQPPARYNDASIVKALEAQGIGRPSTYAPTISTIIARGYVERDEKRLKPTDIAFLVNDLLVAHFPQIVDYQFTADMESDLDAVAEGAHPWQETIKNFYGPFKALLVEKEATLNKKELTETASDYKCPKCGKPMVVKFGRFGKFLACTGYPDCKTTMQIKADGTAEEKQEQTRPEPCPDCGKPVIMKRSRYGSFWGCSGYPECKYTQRIEDKTGVKCPQCNEGDIVAKRSKRGRSFYACNRYPDCKFSLWSKPTGEQCPNCSSLMTYGPKGTVVCSNKECGFKKEADSKKE